MKQLRVLYVEDNPINRLVVEKSLQKLCTIVTEENGFKAIELASHDPYDIYILDLNLGDPDIDGFDVLKFLKSKYKNACYAALTAFSGKEWEEKCLSAGFDLYYNKPINPQSMWGAMVEVLEKKQTQISH